MRHFFSFRYRYLWETDNFTIILTAYFHDVTTLRNEHEQYGRMPHHANIYFAASTTPNFGPQPGKMIALLESQIWSTPSIVRCYNLSQEFLMICSVEDATRKSGIVFLHLRPFFFLLLRMYGWIPFTIDCWPCCIRWTARREKFLLRHSPFFSFLFFSFRSWTDRPVLRPGQFELCMIYTAWRGGGIWIHCLFPTEDGWRLNRATVCFPARMDWWLS